MEIICDDIKDGIGLIVTKEELMMICDTVGNTSIDGRRKSLMTVYNNLSEEYLHDVAVTGDHVYLDLHVFLNEHGVR
jgi:hypothetical protein